MRYCISVTKFIFYYRTIFEEYDDTYIPVFLTGFGAMAEVPTIVRHIVEALNLK